MVGRIKYLGLAFALLFVQCDKEKKPEGLLNHEEMVNLLIEMYLAEARTSAIGVPRDSAIKLFHPHETKIITGMGLNDSLLKANYNYYLRKPEELEIIMDAVIDTLSLREQRAGEKP